MRLSIEVTAIAGDDEGAEISMYLDSSGLDYLLAQLSHLKEGKTDHVHFFSREWGADDLTEERWNTHGMIGRHLKIYLRPEGETPKMVERGNGGNSG